MTLVIVAFLLAAFFQGKKLIKDSDWKGLVAFGVLLIIGFILSMLKMLDILIPDPVEAFKKIIDNFYGIFQ